MLLWPRLRIVGVIVQVATCATPTINLLSICGVLILGGCIGHYEVIDVDKETWDSVTVGDQWEGKP